MRIRSGIGFTAVLALAALTVMAEEMPKTEGEVFDLDPREVYAQKLEQPDLVFKVESPRMAYYEPPELPRGELILALDFIDRYREEAVPGEVKWAAIVTFPWVDGYEGKHIQWLCLYLWNGTIYGFNPTAEYDSEMRFVYPVPFEKREDRVELFAMAEQYVERISPEDMQVIYMEDIYGPQEFETDPETGELTYSDEYYSNDVEYIDIPAGRIEGWLPSHQGKKDLELVTMPYQFIENPNKNQTIAGTMGPSEQYQEDNSFWNKHFSFKIEKREEPFDTARELLKPRWSCRAVLHYEKDVLFFKDVNHKAEVLLFNIGSSIWAYHTRYGVWKTKATVAMLSEGRGANMITYPGIEEPERVLLLPFGE
jgi:hypothetical protein